MKNIKVISNAGIAAIICACLLSGCASAERAIPVGAADVRVGTFSNGYATVGEVKPETQVDVMSKYSGTVEQTFKEAGDEVLAGDALLQLDTTSVMNQIKSAQAAFDQTNATVAQAKLQYQAAVENASVSYDTAQLAQQQAQNDYDNSKSLFEAGAISKTALDAAQLAKERADASAATAKTALDTARQNLAIYTRTITTQNTDSAAVEAGGAQAAVNAARTQLDISKTQMEDYTVTSPIDGIVISKNVVDGGTTGQGPVYSVANIDIVTISTAVPKEEINKLSLGGKAQVFYADNSSVETPITAISNSANASNLYMVQVAVENKDHYFKPGMNARIVFVESQNRSIIVPYESVISAGKDNYIFIAENNQAKKIPVKVLGKNSDEISIEPVGGDLAEGAQVVTRGAGLLKDGDYINIEN